MPKDTADGQWKTFPVLQERRGTQEAGDGTLASCLSQMITIVKKYQVLALFITQRKIFITHVSPLVGTSTLHYLQEENYKEDGFHFFSHFLKFQNLPANIQIIERQQFKRSWTRIKATNTQYLLIKISILFLTSHIMA